MLIYFVFLLLAQIILFQATVQAQIQASENYSIGHQQLNFVDIKRNNRPISAELYYPVKQTNQQQLVADGTFPVVIFSHGYQQHYTNYHYIWEQLVSTGYMMIFLTTEAGLFINIDEYSQDIVFLLQQLYHGELTKHHIIAKYFNGNSALMGHSTGAGASVLAQAQQNLSKTTITLAALGELYGPIFGSSPIESAAKVNTPTLVLSGAEDCICPVTNHQQPIYDRLAAKTKVMLIINGADHCGFTDSWKCPVTESIACALSQKTTMENGLQIALTIQYLLPWLEYFLKEKPAAWSDFKSIIRNKHQVKVQFDDNER